MFDSFTIIALSWAFYTHNFQQHMESLEPPPACTAQECK